MDFNLKGGGRVVQALNIIENSKHVKVMAYGLVLTAILFGLAALVSAW